MDVVITYVDGLDPQWQQDYAATVGMETMLSKRFRDWGTLPYLLRGIESYMPFVENVYLLVSGPSQRPSWASDELRVVSHADIIPEQLLPNFNSCTIEMFLHRIPGLSEEFIYFNDDMFPLRPCQREDFFQNGKARIGMSLELLSLGMYKRQCRASSDLARQALGLRKSIRYVRPQHICSPMLRSASAECYGALESTILARSSRLRQPCNPNQYLYLDYLYFSGRLENCRISNTHISQGVYSASRIAEFIRKPRTDFACINDVEMSDEKYAQMRREMLSAFADRLSVKSRFEL